LASGLPNGLFSNPPKKLILVNVVGPCMGDIGIFYGLFVYLTAIWLFGYFMVTWYIFPVLVYFMVIWYIFPVLVFCT
jgi:hypothetical protein